MQAHMVDDKTGVHRRTRGAELTVTNAVWIATALLQKRHPERAGFPVDEIAGLVAELDLTDGADKSVRQHVMQHSVANKKPQPNTVCMLFDPGGGLRRLYREGDEVYPGRNAARTHPKWDELPAEYEFLRRWYQEEWMGRGASAGDDPLLALMGSGKEIWKSEDADTYVARLRSEWGDRR